MIKMRRRSSPNHGGCGASARAPAPARPAGAQSEPPGQAGPPLGHGQWMGTRRRPGTTSAGCVSSGAARSYKGMVRVDDAKRAVDAGVSAIAVSNHGGNNWTATRDHPVPLPAIADAVGDQVSVATDGGIPARQRRRQKPWHWRPRGDDRPGLPNSGRQRQAGVETSGHPCTAASTPALRGAGQGHPRPHPRRHPDRTASPEPSGLTAPLVPTGLTGRRDRPGIPGPNNPNNRCTTGEFVPPSAGGSSPDSWNSTSRQLHDTSPVVWIPWVPPGSTGPHLPLDTDTRIATAAAAAVAGDTADALLASALSHYGASVKHEGFPGTVSRSAARRPRASSCWSSADRR